MQEPAGAPEEPTIPLGTSHAHDEQPAARTEPVWALPAATETRAYPSAQPDSEFWNPVPAQAVPEHKQPHVMRAALAWFIAAMLGAAAGGGAVYLRLGNHPPGEIRLVNPSAANAPGLPVNAPARVAAAVLPSIVQIHVVGLQGEGLGSGVIYSSSGYIITNNHVIDGADSITVNLPDGESLPGAVVGTAAPAVDIAVVKVVPKTPLTPATIGTTVGLHVGDLAVAIGSPFGLDATVTSGIISALHRNGDLGGGERITDAIQTDAPINPGNSGGALSDANNAVIGINTAIVGGSGGNVGIGFAIPIDIARKVADQIIKTGHAQLSFLGISGENLPEGAGAHVSEVQSGGPAAKAGIKVDDVIVSLNGQQVTSMDQLIELLIQHNVGDVVTVGIQRGGSKLTLKATLAARPGG
jgi:S1-C subfamily serine protease